VIQGSLSARKVEKQSPLLAGLHRITTGALAGLGLTMLGLSALTVHGQNQWARSYASLEEARVLEHRLQESAALLERHHLNVLRRPGLVVPTSSERLIHLPAPDSPDSKPSSSLLANIRPATMPAGF
jgi:hypothetical protein